MPIGSPMVEDGALVVADGLIRAVGRWSELRGCDSGRVEDLGEVVVIPGLVNVHAHLDYSGMAGQLPAPRHFPDWIKGILALKAARSYTEYAQEWLQGAGMLLRHGTTTVLDIEAVPELLPDVWTSTPLRVCSCLELTGVRSGRDPEAMVAEAVAWASGLPVGRCWSGLSPHAPYSTKAGLLRHGARVARERDWLLTMHVAESVEEFDMYMKGSGAMHDWLKLSGRDMSDCGGHSPVAWLAAQGVFEGRFIAVHANYLAEGDAELLAGHGVGVAHCPRSHAYFGHVPFSYGLLRKQGVGVALATDSLASVRCSMRDPAELDLFEEMRTFAVANPGVEPEEILGMVTTEAARMLGRSGELGCLQAGSLADLVVLDVGSGARSMVEAVIAHRGPVKRVMIGGEWVFGEEGF
jgi:cytosine/adenosine deaminase-related metal-dependent hydrolase